MPLNVFGEKIGAWFERSGKTRPLTLHINSHLLGTYDSILCFCDKTAGFPSTSSRHTLDKLVEALDAYAPRIESLHLGVCDTIFFSLTSHLDLPRFTNLHSLSLNNRESFFNITRDSEFRRVVHRVGARLTSIRRLAIHNADFITEKHFDGSNLTELEFVNARSFNREAIQMISTMASLRSLKVDLPWVQLESYDESAPIRLDKITTFTLTAEHKRFAKLVSNAYLLCPAATRLEFRIKDRHLPDRGLSWALDEIIPPINYGPGDTEIFDACVKYISNTPELQSFTVSGPASYRVAHLFRNSDVLSQAGVPCVVLEEWPGMVPTPAEGEDYATLLHQHFVQAPVESNENENDGDGVSREGGGEGSGEEIDENQDAWWTRWRRNLKRVEI